MHCYALFCWVFFPKYDVLLSWCHSVPHATVWCVNSTCFSTSSTYDMVKIKVVYLDPLHWHTNSNDMNHRGHHIATWLSSLCIFFPPEWYFSSLFFLITNQGHYVIFRCNVFLLFVTVCLLTVWKSFHFSYLMNKTMFALIYELLALCNHICTRIHTFQCQGLHLLV